MAAHCDRVVMAVSCRFENIRGDIVLMAELQGHAACVKAGLRQRFTGLSQDRAFGLPLLPDPSFPIFAQAGAQLFFDSRVLSNQRVLRTVQPVPAFAISGLSK